MHIRLHPSALPSSTVAKSRGTGYIPQSSSSGSAYRITEHCAMHCIFLFSEETIDDINRGKGLTDKPITILSERNRFHGLELAVRGPSVLIYDYAAQGDQAAYLAAHRSNIAERPLSQNPTNHRGIYYVFIQRNPAKKRKPDPSLTMIHNSDNSTFAYDRV
jgi:hypothetical protein